MLSSEFGLLEAYLNNSDFSRSRELLLTRTAVRTVRMRHAGNLICCSVARTIRIHFDGPDQSHVAIREGRISVRGDGGVARSLRHRGGGCVDDRIQASPRWTRFRRYSFQPPKRVDES